MSFVRLSGLLTMFAIPLVAACSSEQDEKLDQLAAARAVWSADAPATYEFTYQRFCFCPNVALVRILVDGGLVTRVIDVESSTTLPSERNDEFPTIDELFIELEELIRRDPFRLDVTYDADLGFPALVSVDIDERIVDEEFGYTVDDVTTLPAPEVRS